MLCVLASTALAGEHYTEVWNPPEARTPEARMPAARTPAAHPATPEKKAHAHHGAKHKLARLDTRKVAEPALRASAATVPVLPNMPNGVPNGAAHGGSKSDRDGTPFIPPQIGPDGNVLQVSYAAPARRAQKPLMLVPTTIPAAGSSAASSAGSSISRAR
nr:hypothetical protein [Paraburkholderia tagetis]